MEVPAAPAAGRKRAVQMEETAAHTAAAVAALTGIRRNPLALEVPAAHTAEVAEAESWEAAAPAEPTEATEGPELHRMTRRVPNPEEKAPTLVNRQERFILIRLSPQKGKEELSDITPIAQAAEVAVLAATAATAAHLAVAAEVAIAATAAMVCKAAAEAAAWAVMAGMPTPYRAAEEAVSLPMAAMEEVPAPLVRLPAEAEAQAIRLAAMGEMALALSSTKRRVTKCGIGCLTRTER